MAKKGFIRRSFQEELLPPQVKELETVKLNQCIVLLVGAKDKGLQKHLFLVEACPQDKEKTRNALIATSGIRVFAEG